MDFRKQPVENSLSHSLVAYISYTSEDIAKFVDTYYPNGKTALVFHFEDPVYFKTTSNRWNVMPKMSIVSFVTMPVSLKMQGKLDTLAVVMLPYSLYNLFKLKPDIKISSVDASNYLPESLYAKLKSVNDFNKRVVILNKYFGELFEKYNPEADNFKKICDYIILKNGMVERKDVADIFSVSENYIHKLFIQKVGISIKPFSQVIRVSKILEEMHNTSSSDWFDIYVKYGYYDQSHFIKDFKKVINQTPLQYFKNDTTISAMMSGIKN